MLLFILENSASSRFLISPSFSDKNFLHGNKQGAHISGQDARRPMPWKGGSMLDSSSKLRWWPTWRVRVVSVHNLQRLRVGPTSTG